jgi:hypothetical protein
MHTSYTDPTSLLLWPHGLSAAGALLLAPVWTSASAPTSRRQWRTAAGACGSATAQQVCVYEPQQVHAYIKRSNTAGRASSVHSKQQLLTASNWQAAGYGWHTAAGSTSLQQLVCTEVLLLLLLTMSAAGEKCRLLVFLCTMFTKSDSDTLLLLLLLLTVCAAGEECRMPDFPCTMFTCNPAAALNGPILTVAAITAAAHGAAATAAAAVGNQQAKRRGGVAAAAAGVPQGPLQLVSCPRMCLQRQPLMVNASFSDDGTRIQVRFKV